MAIAQLSAAPRPPPIPWPIRGTGRSPRPTRSPVPGGTSSSARPRGVDRRVSRPARRRGGHVHQDARQASAVRAVRHRDRPQQPLRDGHLRRVRRPVTVDGCPRWVWHTFFSRTARDDAWWSAFWRGAAGHRALAGAARSAAYGVLARLGRIDARLTLSSAECGALEEPAAEWFARGAGEAQLVQAVMAGLPERVAHPYGFVRARLLGKLPPEPVETRAAC